MNMSSVKLKLIKNTPFDVTAWPGFWIWVDGSGSGSSFEVAQFSRRFSKEDPLPPLRLHISADNRYKLYLDGQFVGLGPQSGDLSNWFFDTYELLPDDNRGDHVLTVVVWHDRDSAPTAQISARPGLFIVEERLDTGEINPPVQWKARHWNKTRTLPPPEEAINIGSGFDTTGFLQDERVPSAETFEKQFAPVVFLGRARNHRKGSSPLLLPWQLRPRTIPALVSERCKWGSCRRITGTGDLSALKDQINQLTCGSASGTSTDVRIPPRSHIRVLIDTDVLTMGYPVIQTSQGAGAVISMTYQEALQSNAEDVTSKANRNDVEGRVMVGITDQFRPDGRDDLLFEPFWYRCWRYIELDISTAEEPLVLRKINYRSTGYPLEIHAEFEADSWFSRLIEPGERTLRLCMGETFMDCPYYEQLQYEGDFLIQALLTYVLSGDDRLPRQAIEMFSQSRLATGLTLSRYPARVPQIIPLFSLLHIVSLHDFLMWRGDLDFIRKQMDSIDSVLRAYKQYLKPNGLVGNLPGMLFADWAWETRGAPPGANEGNSFLCSFFYLYALQKAAKIYKHLGNRVMAGKLNIRAERLQAILQTEAFKESEQVFVDEPSGIHLSQHTNILAILTNTHEGLADGEALLDNVLNDHRMTQVTPYFAHFLFEAMHHVGRADLIWPALEPWHEMLDNGLSTFTETPEPTRSDCHGWSVHPLYHFFASVLGVRPEAPGCSKISIRPAPFPKTGGSLPLPVVLGGTLMTPQGKCSVRLEAGEHGWQLQTKLPKGIEQADGMDDSFVCKKEKVLCGAEGGYRS